MFFCILFFSVAGFVFAKSDFIISPVEGQWANYQSIIIDVPEGATAFYSFTGDNPLYSGFAYESPVLLELEGDINLKVAILNKDDTVIEESVNFSVNKVPLEVPFYSESQTNAVVLVKEKNLSIPSFMRYSLDDFQEPYLKGRTLTVDSKNSLEQILPLIIQNGRSLYRFMLHVLPNVSNENNQYNLTNTFSNDSSFEDDYTVRRIEKKLSQVPFTLEFDDWSNPVESSEEFFNTYYARPIMLRVRTSGSDVYAPCIGYSINSGKLYLNYMLNNAVQLVNTKLAMSGSTSTSTSTST
jgi:hypothetical protein